MRDRDGAAAAHEEASFEQLGILPELAELLRRNRLDAPTAVQIRMVPAVLAGKDVLTRVRSGAGKTNAYILPIVQNVVAGGGHQALVIQPNRALVTQLERNFSRYTPLRGLRAEQPSLSPQSREARPIGQSKPGEAEILVCTLRAFEDYVDEFDPALDGIRYVVIDEAEVVVDEYTAERVRESLARIPGKPQILLLAASLEPSLVEFAREYQRDAEVIEMDVAGVQLDQLDHVYIRIQDDKFDALLTLIKQQKPRLAAVYARDEETGRRIAERMSRARVDARWISEPPQRRGRRDAGGPPAPGVVVTDDANAARLSGLPVTQLLQFDAARDADGYRRRIEACPRLAKQSLCLTLLEPDDEHLLAAITPLVGASLREMPAPPPYERAGGRDRAGGGERRERGGRGGPRRGDGPRRSERPPQHTAFDAESGQASGELAEAGTATAPPPPRPVPPPGSPFARWMEPLRRDPDLEARGIKPMPRTLGSRFRTDRR